MNACSQCGSTIPDRQRVCSMCYGDPDYGTDGHYRRWMEEQERQRLERESSEQDNTELETK